MTDNRGPELPGGWERFRETLRGLLALPGAMLRDVLLADRLMERKYGVSFLWGNPSLRDYRRRRYGPPPGEPLKPHKRKR
ncbi:MULTISPECIES: hypothetical protein [Anaerotruncus]|uniref:Uncharacterized protein n=2 Tax=Anaerotruncus TaxID=244127 RepID=A0A498CLR9_9FIRM|nr:MULTISPECIES: hypothetical protein [Anaerotruncus]MBC3939213.1 hypothetical protein [Anaerotruncus massiliensis (ex Togo et al. 2019)]MCQ4897298.1 hypothetical protein [Anaerotruncus sp. DFI.9.16]RLL09784.1 hypothetical protein D4A47_09735 [Anaerotruncus massiliensis (ex Liu et al. 2021)]